jgi:hypothetical protein
MIPHTQCCTNGDDRCEVERGMSFPRYQTSDRLYNDDKIDRTHPLAPQRLDTLEITNELTESLDNESEICWLRKGFHLP